MTNAARHADGANGTGAARAPVLVTGGAGFVGINLAERLLDNGERVVIFDNLSRPGVDENLRWLAERHGERMSHVAGDIRDKSEVAAAVRDCSFVYHLAGQVAVTTSLREPLEDHAVNLRGTLNVLEAIRRAPRRPGLMFASTNKVYGALADVGLEHAPRRSVPDDEALRRHGIGEDRPLEFISPYGCSKGAADQYVLDYCRSFGLSAVVFRMSCIYGPHQQASSDQGWLAHFLRSALAGRTLTIFGDGRQVRDVLYVDDFVDALLAARDKLHRVTGQAFNIGGGTTNTLSLLEMIAIAERLTRSPVDLHFTDPRPGDQRWFAADHRRFTTLTGWRPTTAPEAGIEQLWSWLLESPRFPDKDTAPDVVHGGMNP